MPTKKISDRQRLITYASQCNQEQPSEAIETFQAIYAGRWPKEPRKQARGRKSAKKQAATLPPELFQDDTERELTTEEAGADLSKLDSKRKPSRRSLEKFTPDPHMLAAIEENKRDRIAETSD